MGYEQDFEAGRAPVKTMYKIRVKDVFDRVTEYPLDSLEEFTSLVTSLGSEKVVLNTSDNSIEIIPRLVNA